MKLFLSIPLLLISLNNFGQIIHRTVNPPIHNPSYIDLDSNGVNEYNIYSETKSSGSQGGNKSTNLVEITNNADNLIACVGPFVSGTLIFFNNNDTIDNSDNWVAYNKTPGSWGNLGICGSYGSICDGVYVIGLKFLINSNYHYGWFKYKLTNGYAIDIIEYAYNSTPNDPLVINSSISTTNQPIEEEQLYVYPNPFVDILYIDNNFTANNKITLSDEVGNIIFSDSNIREIKTSNLPIGVYFLKLEFSDLVINRKIVKINNN